MLIDVLTRLSADTGLGIVQKRESLLQILNSAAKEIRAKLECNSIYREISVVVPKDKIIALPSIIGDIKGMRLSDTCITVDLNSLYQPKYVTDINLYKFRNWRDLGESPVHTLPAAIGPISFYPKAIEEVPVTIKISGPTNLSSKSEESVVLDNINGKSTVKLFGPTIDSIICVQKRLYDIVVKDSLGNEIAILHNTFDKTRYKLMDVSEYAWPSTTAADEFVMDICYKLPATKLVNDSDSFYAGDEYDDAWYCMAMHIFLDPIANRKEDSLMFRAKCTDLLQSSKDSKESGIMKTIEFGPNKFYDLFPQCWGTDPRY